MELHTSPPLLEEDEVLLGQPPPPGHTFPGVLVIHAVIPDQHLAWLVVYF